MQLSKALQPGLHIPLEEVTRLKCKRGKLLKLISLRKNPFMKMLIHAVSLPPTTGGKTSQGWILEFRVT